MSKKYTPCVDHIALIPKITHARRQAKYLLLRDLHFNECDKHGDVSIVEDVDIHNRAELAQKGQDVLLRSRGPNQVRGNFFITMPRP